ncbi:VOC family protein [Kribbella sp. NPDC059898]|uniref:VOC family protein n=1 Tax=Kribbella sp. NPDC059898 TaxID=3346995 RepID=UPI003663897B
MSLQELRFRASHLDAVRDGTKRITMRYNDPVEVGPATLVFEFDEEVRLPGRIVSTVAKRIDAVTEAEALEDGFAGAYDVIAGLSSYYPDLRPSDELVIVRFELVYPRRMHTALDATDARGLAEFYRDLLGLRFRPGDDDTWIVLLDADGNRQLAIQQVSELKRSTWPSPEVPMQAHLDYAVPSVEELERHRQRAEELGARVLNDRSADAGEPLYVLADPAGHPFCLLVADL